MEEKIIEAKFKRNSIAKYVFFAGAGLVILAVVLAIIEYATGEVYHSGYYSALLNHRFEGYWEPKTEYYDNFFSYIVSWLVFEDVLTVILLYLGVLTLISSFVLYWAMSKCALMVTSYRVTGKATFGKVVDLPLSQISALGLGLFSSMAIATSSGKIHFWLIDNREAIHSELSNLMGHLQTAKVESPATPAATNTADELKKYKDLLDAGVITQEEFDAKKKQLLNL